MAVVTVAGRRISDPFTVIANYARDRNGRTLRMYDLAGPGDPPGLVPILDTHVRALYRAQARCAADRHNRRRPAVRYAYWVAIRGDLLNPADINAPEELRCRLKQQDDPLVRAAGRLTARRRAGCSVRLPAAPPGRGAAQ